MALKLNPVTGELDLIMSPGGGTATIQIDGDTGSATPDGLGVFTVAGGIGVTTSAATNTLIIDATGGGFTWNEETGTSATMAVENGYIANNASLVTLTLPATATVGEQIQVAGKGAGLFKIAQNASQTIHFINADTTTGTGGSLTAIEQYDCIELLCITENTDWSVTDSAGNFTIA